MKSYTELSQPAEPEEAFLSGAPLREAVKATQASNSEIANGIGKSSATISLWLSGTYRGDNAGIEAGLREWLRDRTITAISGVQTIETETSRAICRHLDETRQAGELALIISAAGLGKSRGQSLYLIDHTLAIAFRVRPWHSGMAGLAKDLSQAADITRATEGKTRWETIVEKTNGAGRLLIVDDAHELSPRGLQCCVDWHEQTGNAVALVGLPGLKKLLSRDARRARRVGDVYELPLRNPQPLVEHLVDQLAPDANGERSGLVKLACEVASHEGHFGAVEKQLKKAARWRKKKPGTEWLPAFRAAHLRLLRNYTLTAS